LPRLILSTFGRHDWKYESASLETDARQTSGATFRHFLRPIGDHRHRSLRFTAPVDDATDSSEFW
jgi:hypothetical protein